MITRICSDSAQDPPTVLTESRTLQFHHAPDPGRHMQVEPDVAVVEVVAGDHADPLQPVAQRAAVDEHGQCRRVVVPAARVDAAVSPGDNAVRYPWQPQHLTISYANG